MIFSQAGFSKDGDVQVIDVDFVSDVGFCDAGHMFTGEVFSFLDMGKRL